MTLQELINRVRSDMAELDTDGFIQNTDIVNWINEAQFDIVSKTKHLTGSIYIHTAENIDRYDLPSDFIKEFRVLFEGEKVNEILFEERGIKKGYIVWRRELIVSPHPEEDEEIEMEYYRRPQRLSVDDLEETPEIDMHYQHLLVIYALSKALQKENQYNEAQFNLQEYMSGLSTMVQEYSRAPRRKTMKVVRR